MLRGVLQVNFACILMLNKGFQWPRRRLGNIKIGLTDIGWGMRWTDLAQERHKWRALVIAVMGHRVP